MKPLVHLTLLLFLSTCSLSASATTDTTQTYSSEKAFIHTDRDQYLPGDTVWFRAHVVDAKLHRPHVLSRVLYVSLTDPAGRVLARQRVDVRNGKGHLVMTDDVVPGRYQLAAYTNWMRNDGDPFLFRKTLTVLATNGLSNAPTGLGSLDAANATPSSTVAPRPDVQFFPEGGHLVEGLLSRVAFKAVGPDGFGTTVSGRIETEAGELVTPFTTEYRGMGLFTFTPLAGHRYRAVVQANGTDYVLNLPTPLIQGVTLAAYQASEKDDLRVQIGASRSFEGKTVYLLAHLRGQTVFTQTLRAEQTTLNTRIPAGQLPKHEGILHLTVFDSEQKPVAERLVYINRNQRLNMNMEVAQTAPASGSLLTLNLTVADPTGQPAAGQFSIAVTDADQSTPDRTQPLLPTYLALTSDLTGFVEEPQAYFGAMPKAGVYLDYLMMTQGWRRFNWNTLLSVTGQTPKFELEQGLTWRGQVLSGQKLLTNEPVLTLLRAGEQATPTTMSTDVQGTFTLQTAITADTLTGIFRTKNPRALQIKLMDDYVPQMPSNIEQVATSAPAAAPTVDEAVRNKAVRLAMERDRLQRQQLGERVIDLNEVGVKAKRTDPIKADPRRSMYGGEPSYSVKVEPNMIVGSQPLAILVGRVPGFVLPDRQQLMNDRSLANYKGPGLLLLDGTITDYSTIDALNPMHIDRIDVLRPPMSSIYGVRGSGGAINIILKKGTDALPAPANTLLLSLTGYTPTREFYVPMFTPTSTSQTSVDFRATRYWNPSIQTDATGRASISFPTDGRSANLRVVVQGLTMDGQAGSLEYRIPTEKLVTK